jgi:hypothetical protein
MSTPHQPHKEDDMEKRSMSRLTRWFGAAMVAAVLLGAAAASADENKQVVPPSEVYGGLTYGQWAAAWWQWAFHVPANPNHPIFPGGNTLLVSCLIYIVTIGA